MPATTGTGPCRHVVPSFGAALAEADSNTHALSHLHLRTAAASGDSLSGVYKACPSLPFTVTAKLADAVATNAGHKAGLFIGDSTPTKVAFVCFGGEAGGSSLYGTFEAQVYTNLTTWGSNLLQSLIPNGYPPAYLRIIAASSTDVTFLYSHNGLAWITLAANVNPSMTVATVGLLVNRNASHQGEAFFDWIRFS